MLTFILNQMNLITNSTSLWRLCSLSLSPSCSRILPTPPYLSQWKQTTKQAKNLQNVYIIIEKFSIYIKKRLRGKQIFAIWQIKQTENKIFQSNCVTFMITRIFCSPYYTHTCTCNNKHETDLPSTAKAKVWKGSPH